MAKSKFYSLTKILEKTAQYNMIIGERSNGKTYSVLKYGIQKYIETGEQLGIIRRWRDDFTGKRGSTLFDALVINGEIEKLSNGEWNNIYYYGGRWFLCRPDGKGGINRDETPIAYGFALTSMEHDKSTSYPMITTICFDEFLTRSSYLPDEFVLFCNTLSTIIRHRDNVKIFMLGNTVNKYCPYFAEMGISHIKNMQPGNIDIYRYGDSKLKVAVEYCATSQKNGGKDSDFYFAFDNPKLTMITGGAWEIDIYPHCPCKYKPNEILFTYFINFNDELLQCEIINHNDTIFTFIHRKTTPIKDDNTDIIFTTEYDHRPNHRRKISTPVDNLNRKLYHFYVTDNVYYQDNEVGEIIRNYLQWCKTES